VVTVLLEESPRPAAVREHRWAPWFAVTTVCFGAFMGQLDASIVTLAFPALQHEFGVPLAAAQWVSLGYLLVLVALLIPAGGWSDRAGRKLIYLYGFAVFTAASAACGFATSMAMLVGLRLVQAVGAAMLQANSVALVTTSVPPGRRRAALGVQAGAQAIGLALGPTIGGLLIAAVSWRWIFWINVPIGFLAVTAGWFLLPRTRHRAARRGLDGGGLTLVAVASTASLLVLSSAAGMPIGVPEIVGLLAIAGTGVAGLIWWERRAAQPLLDRAVWSGSRVGIGLTGALLAYLVLFGPLVLFPQIVAGGRGVLAAGLMLTALPAGFGLAAVAADRILPAVWSDRRRCTAGAGLATVAAAALMLPATATVRVLLLALLGVGLGVYIPVNNATIMAEIPTRMAATAGGMLNMARGLGTAVGVTAVAVALHIAEAFGGGADVRVAVGMGVLTCAALAAVWASRSASTATHPTRPVRRGSR